MKKMKVAVLGLGTVGAGVPKILTEHQQKIKQVTGVELVVSHALVTDIDRKKALADQYGIELTTDYQTILDNPEIQIVVELIGKIEPAKSYILCALEHGKHVVTANKDLLALHGNELVQIAKKHHCDLYYEASVAGGIPILRTISNSLAADNIHQVMGIVNGTTNYMLTKMIETGSTYQEALSEAQALGFAESDPTNDVDGIDAAYKMTLLTQFAFGMNVAISDIDIRGIRGIAKDDIQMIDSLGYVVKLLGSSTLANQSVSVDVGPVLVPKDHPLATVNNEMNAVFVKSSGVGESMYYGPGAGEKPTATSVVSDLITVAKNTRLGINGHLFNSYQSQTKLTPKTEMFGHYYFSINVPDTLGQFAQLTQLFAEKEINLAQIIQQKSDGQTARIVGITHQVSQAQIELFSQSLEQISGFSLQALYKVLA